MDKKGFALLELCVVLVVVGIMVAVAIPRFSSTVKITRQLKDTRLDSKALQKFAKTVDSD